MGENNTQTNSEQQIQIDISVDRKMSFPTLNHTLITSSIEMDGMFSQLFKAAFADFAGFRPCWNKSNGRFTLTACFEQKQFPENAVTAFEAGLAPGKQSGIARIQALYQVSMEGNRYHLTDAAKEAIAKYIGPEGKSRGNNTPNWDSRELVSQLGDPQYQNAMASKTYNVINYIDPLIMLKEIYGADAKIYVGDDEDKNPIIENHPVEYQIAVIGPLPTQQFMQRELQRHAIIQQYYMNNQPVPNDLLLGDTEMISHDPVKLMISQIDGNVLESSAKAVGFQYQNNLGIDI